MHAFRHTIILSVKVAREWRASSPNVPTTLFLPSMFYEMLRDMCGGNVVLMEEIKGKYPAQSAKS
jgi:hypothetical protein